MNTAGTTALRGNRSFFVDRGGKPPAAVPKLNLWSAVRDGLPRGFVGEVNRYRWRNLANIWRGFWRVAVAWAFNIPTHIGALRAVVVRDGVEINLGLISLRVVTTAGVNFIVDAFQNTVEVENLKFHGYGTNNTAEAVGDTTLNTELTTQYPTDNVRPTGSTTEGAANVYRTVATLDPDADVAIVEHGIFSATAAGTLLDRSVFTVINLSGAGGDTLQTTYDLTFTAGS
jgi:hypothetical protein